MKRPGLLMTLIGFVALASPLLAQQGADQQDVRSKTVIFAQIRGTIDPATADYLESSIRLAEREKAQALVVELDTPGGLVTSVRQMAQAVDESRVPVVVYVTPAGSSATSAGALLMLASHVGAMAPGTNIGAAHPVGGQGEEIKGPMGDKVLKDVSAFARSLAELRGRSPELAEKIVTESESMTAPEAHSKKLIDIVAASRSELLRQLDGREISLREGDSRKLDLEGAIVREAEMTFGQKVLHLLSNPNIAAILMTLGMLLIYVEISNPGITIAGALGVICLLVAFIAFQTLPIQAGGLALLILGIVLMVAEPFAPTAGALAVSGAVSFTLGLLWLVDPDQSTVGVSMAVWLPAGIALGTGAIIVGVAIARIRKLSSQAYAQSGGGGLQGLRGYTGVIQEVAPDQLSGKVLIRGEIWNFLSKEPMTLGDSVTVDRVKGFKLHVKKVS